MATTPDQGIFVEPTHVTVLRRLRLIRPEHRAQALRRVIMVVVVAWVPLAILCAVPWLAFGDEEARSFFIDVGAYGRFLLAVPILILSEYIILPRLEATAQQFLKSNLIDYADRGRFDDAVASSRRLSITIWPSTGMTLFVYVLVIILAITIPQDILPAWQKSDHGLHKSLAWWWHMLVSTPLVLGLLLSWIWRIGVWARFLLLVSRMRLRLVPSHPDKAAGLQFVSYSPRLFAPLGLAVGVIAASSMANEVIHLGLKPVEHGAIPIITAVAVVLVFIGPPLVFGRALLMTWRRGVFDYGALAGRVGAAFEDKWLSPGSKVDASALSAPDFSATTDLYSITANVYAMRPILFDPRAAAALALSALLPFAPIWMSVIPAKTLISHLIGLLV